ncbi:MAG TPA: tetratricopeptide repeat protein, partial [Terriglobia bacterium]|nr:tetratricopeptide repeat protein [Terriglobia bacterium]
AVLYEMATGTMPFRGDTSAAIFNAILERPPITPVRLNPDIPPKQEDVINKALEKDRNLRYQHAADMRADLQRLKRDTESGRKSAVASMQLPEVPSIGSAPVVSAPAPSAPSGSSAAATPTPVPAQVSSSAAIQVARKQPWLALVAAAVVIAGVTGFFFFHNRGAGSSNGHQHKSVAVLYFSNLSQDQSLNWLDNGLTDMLTTNLAQVKGLDVLSTERVLSAVQRATKDGKSLDPARAQSVARDAGADAYITGALLKIGPTQLRLDVRAQDTSTGQILFSQKLEGQDIQSIFGMVDRLTESLAGSFLPASDLPQKTPEIEQASTSNVEAYRHYQLGLDYGRRFLTSDAIRELEEAVHLDPQFALAYLRLSDQYFLGGDLRRGREVAAKVEQLQSHLPRYEQLSLQAVKASWSQDMEAEAAARQAVIAEFPHSTMDRGILSGILFRLGKGQEALEVLKQGLTLDPKSEDLLNFQAYGLTRAGDLAGGLAADDAYIAVRPGDPNPFDSRGDILFMAGHDDEAVAAYRKVLELKPDFSEYGEYLKLAIVYTDQKKTDMANAAFQQYVQRTSALGRLYVPGFRAQFKQTGGDFEGALASYREAVSQMAHAKQTAAAGDYLLQFAVLAVLLGQHSSALSFVQQQKLDGEELTALAFLQTMAGNGEASQRTLQRYASSHPWIAARTIELRQIYADVVTAVQKGDGQTALDRLTGVPDFQDSYVLFFRGRAALLTNDYSSAETRFRAVQRVERNLENGQAMADRFPCLGILSHYYLGQLYERTSKRDQAINEYQEFLSHFSGSRSGLVQVSDARSALQRLMR